MHSSRHRVPGPPAAAPDDAAAEEDPEPALLLPRLGAARGSWAMDRQAATSLPGLPGSVPVARRFVRITAVMWHLSADTLAGVELCMSELVSNAVTHTDSRQLHCRLWSARGLIFLEVDDEDCCDLPKPAAAEEPAADDEHGRGMMLVESFSTAWGTLPGPGPVGKTVWAALPLPEAACPLLSRPPGAAAAASVSPRP